MTKSLLPDLITLKEAAEILKCHPNTLRLWDKDGTLRAIRIGKRKARRYKREEILNFLVTEKHKADEERLTHQKTVSTKKKYLSMVKSIAHGFLSMDRRMRFTYVNDSMLPILNRKKDEVIGQKITDTFTPEEREPFYYHARVALRKKIPAQYEFFSPSLHKWMFTSIYPSEEGITAHFADITQLKEEKKKSERLFREIVDNTPVMIWLSHASRRNYYFNRYWLEFTGRTLEEELKNAFHHGVHADDQKESFKQFGRAFRRRDPFVLEYRLLRHDGTYRWVQDTGQPRYSSDGQFIGYIGYCVDITDRKEAERELEQRLKQQSAVASFGQLALTETNLNRLFEQATQIVSEVLHVPFCHVLKYLPKQKKFFSQAGVGWEFHEPMMIQADSKYWSGYVIQQKEPILFEDIFNETRFKLSSIFTKKKVKSGIGLAISGDKQPYAILGAYSTESYQFSRDDISFIQSIGNILGEMVQWQESQLVLQTNEERYRLTVEGIKDYAIFMLDLDGKVSSWNTGAQRLLGYSSEEVMGKYFSFLFTKKDISAKRPEKEVQTAIRKGSVEDENWAVRKDGSLFWASGVTTAIHDEEGKLIELVKIIRDMSQAKQMEKEKDQFVSLVSHELKNPITSLSVFTQLLEERLKKNKDEEGQRFVSKLDAQTKKISSLISNLLEQSKVRAQGFSFKDKVFDVDELVAEVVEDMQRSKSTHKIVVEGKVSVKMSADRARIGQVLENLISNAIKYSLEADRVIVKVAVEESEVVLSVQDFGIGIPKQNINKIFVPFFRATDAQREVFPSIGLGLYITAVIVKHYKGDIKVESREKKGTTFFIRLPIHKKTNNL